MIVGRLLKVLGLNLGGPHGLVVMRKGESSVQGVLHNERSLLELLLGVLLVDSLVMVVRVVAALNHHGYK